MRTTFSVVKEPRTNNKWLVLAFTFTVPGMVLALSLMKFLVSLYETSR